MGLYTFEPGTGIVHAGADELHWKLKHGDGIHWAGDERLELGMETQEAQKGGWIEELGRYVRKGQILARRYAVYRHNEDGTFNRIGHWRLEEYDRILFDIAGLRAESPNHEQTSDLIDKANDAAEQAVTDAYVGVGADMLEHRLRIWNDTTQGKNRFRGMPGMRDLIKPKAKVTKKSVSA
jgi:hypothetical protein